MALSFLQIPQSILTPGLFIEYDASRAVQGTPAKKHVSLLIGHQIDTPVSTDDVPYMVSSIDAAKSLFGEGSPLARMVARYKAQDPLTELWCLPIPTPGGAAAADVTFTYTGTTASEAGTVVIYVGDDRYEASVAIGDTPTVVAAAIGGQINSDSDSLVNPADVVGVLTLTALTKGAVGNAIRVAANLREGEKTPAGITLVVSTPTLTSGTGSADITVGLAALGDVQYDSIGSMFNDDANMDLLETLLLARLGPLNPIDGNAFICISDTVGNSTTAGNARNFQNTSLVATQESPTPEFLAAATFTGLDSAANQVDPALHRNTLPMADVMAPPIASRWDQSQRDIALSDGLTTVTYDSGTGLCRIERLITTYQTNAAGFSDTAYLDITAPRILAFLRFSTRAHFATRYSRFKLSGSTDPVPPGQRIMTPLVARAAFIELFDSWLAAGLVEDKKQFVKELIVEIDPNNPDRLNVQVSPNLINSFHILAGSFQFLK